MGRERLGICAVDQVPLFANTGKLFRQPGQAHGLPNEDPLVS